MWESTLSSSPMLQDKVHVRDILPAFGRNPLWQSGQPSGGKGADKVTGAVTIHLAASIPPSLPPVHFPTATPQSSRSFSPAGVCLSLLRTLLCRGADKAHLCFKTKHQGAWQKKTEAPPHHFGGGAGVFTRTGCDDRKGEISSPPPPWETVLLRKLSPIPSPNTKYPNCKLGCSLSEIGHCNLQWIPVLVGVIFPPVFTPWA